ENAIMPRDPLQTWFTPRPNLWRDSQNDASGQCPPHAAKPADDHRLEGENQPRRSDGRIEIGAYYQKYAGDGDYCQGQRHRHREDVTRVESHQLGYRLIV